MASQKLNEDGGDIKEKTEKEDLDSRKPVATNLRNVSETKTCSKELLKCNSQQSYCISSIEILNFWYKAHAFT